jgi:hypothetical protein
MVVLENVVLGVMVHYRATPAQAAAYLAALTGAVIARMAGPR